jgi:predicted Zn finger-like uncharacterized protein
MIIQCEQCDTRFRMADEKLKPGGTKVRCSKCKYVFTVTPPAPEPEPAEEPIVDELPPSEPESHAEAPVSAPVENEADSESVDFGSFNMEQVSDNSDSPIDEPAANEEPTPDLDFSGLEEEMESTAGAGEELAEDFSFASTDIPADTEEEETPSTDNFEIDGAVAEDSQAMDFGAAFEEGSDEAGIAVDDSGDFAFDNQQADEQEESADGFEFNSGEESLEDEGSSEFDFESEATAEDAPDKFSFDDAEETPSFDLDESPSDEAVQEESGEFSFGEDSPGEYSFDEDEDSDSESTTQWDDDNSADDSFDFDEPQFEATDSDSGESGEKSDGDDLQFGEINFAEDDGDENPSFETDGDFAGATMAREEEPDLSPSPATQQAESQPPRERSESEQITAPPAPRKSPVSSVLRLLGILLLLAILGIGGLVGYFFYMDDGLDINRIVQRFPILEEYVGQLPTSTQEQLIAINISGSRYVNNDGAGQLLVIQGEAVNNFTQPRSAIAVKGILLNAQGEVLFQQTVFCGNPLQDEDLQDMSFADIEEAMNNQFGDSLSNMDIAAASKIPFTIVFRNLPAGIANINVEVVDSKPGGS